ncbi:MAG: ATP-binding protein [Pseudomonadota bacterium]
MMWEWLERLFGQGFMPHGHCYLWSPAMIWTQVSSNLLIGFAYAAIASTLVVLVRRIENIPFAWVYLSFGTFILSCGLTHWFDVVTVWHPVYWLDAGVRVLTAIASVATAVLLVPFLPKAVAFASAARLSSERGLELVKAHALLESANEHLARREREALKRASFSEGQFRVLVETMPGLAWISDAAGNTTFRNKRWEAYTGLSVDSPSDTEWRAVHHPDTAQHTVRAWNQALTTKQPFEVESRFRRADGEYRWFLLRAVALLDADDNVLAWMGTGTDIHDQKLLQEEALRTAQMKDEFLATVSHELRTPLNAILGWSQLLLAGTLASDKREKALDSLARNAAAQARLVDDLLDVSRIISGKMRIEPALTNLTEALESALDVVRPAALAKGVELLTTIERDAGLVVADAGRIQQVVWNLLGNAVKFTPKHGQVRVNAARVGAQLEIVVADTGVGIKPEFLAHVFQRFSQEDGSIRRSHGGLGLGLAITKHLVEMHGGSIRAESAGEGHGSRFVVTLPIATASQTNAAEAQRQVRQKAEQDLKGLRLLLVEDDFDSREVVAAILEDSGVIVITATSAEQALGILEAAPHSVDAIISDVGLPGLDGYAFIKAVRKIPALARIPAAALTAYAYPEDRRRAQNAGFQMHLRKPCDQSELLATVVDLAKIAATLKA